MTRNNKRSGPDKHQGESEWNEEPWFPWICGLAILLSFVAVIGSCQGMGANHWDALSNVAIALLTVVLIAVARQQLFEYRRTLRLAHRAWVLLDDVEGSFQNVRATAGNPETATIELTFKNDGDGPALDVSMHWFILIVGPCTMDFPKLPVAPGVETVIGPRSDRREHLDVRYPRRGWTTLLPTGRLDIYVGGLILYRDQFGISHETEFLRRLIMSTDDEGRFGCIPGFGDRAT